ncbi:MAG: hypothetical protein GF331_20525 [Chitinivibrionales bacterium]|nr:hypothetical protein [Chitinivibrionales bacterium]
MKRFALALTCAALFTGCADLQQAGSHFKSSMIGLDRTITLYASDGSVIKQWSGRFKVEAAGASARFIHKGKAVYVAGTFVIEEN